MFDWLWLFIYSILSATASIHSLEIPIPEKININNIALELVLDEKHENNNTKITLSDNAKTDIALNINSRRVFKSEHPDKLTDFIQIVIELLNKLDDVDLQHFFDIIYEEIGKYHYNGCKFHELTDNDALKEFISRKFAEIKNIPAADIRQKILKFSNHIENTKYNIHEKELIDYINSLYRPDAVKKFDKFLLDVNDYRQKIKKDLDLEKIIRNGLRSIIFNHYTKLDYNTRAALKLKLQKYWEYYIMAVPSLRSQLNPKEINLLDNINEDFGTFYYKKKDEYKSKGSKNAPVTLYPKLVMDWKVMNSLPPKPIRKKRRKKTTTRKYTSELGFYNQDYDASMDQQTAIYGSDYDQKQKAILRDRLITGEIFSQVDTDYSNDDKPKSDGSKHHTRTTFNKKVTTYKSMEGVHVPRTELTSVRSSDKHRKFTLGKNKHLKHTEAPIATLYTIYMPDPIAENGEDIDQENSTEPEFIKHAPNKHKKKVIKPVARTETTPIHKSKTTKMPQTHHPFIEVVTMRPFVPKTFRKPQRLKYDINLKSPRYQQDTRRLRPAEDTYFNEDTTAIEDRLSAEESKHGDSLIANRRNDNNQLASETISIDKDLFNRLQQLETELSKVKMQVNNDTEIIQELKHDIQLEDNTNTKTSQELNLKRGESKMFAEKHPKIDTTEIQGKNRRKASFDGSNLEFSDHEMYATDNIGTHNSFDRGEVKTESKEIWQSEAEKGVLPISDRDAYKKSEERAINFNSSGEKKEIHARRAIMNKVAEIKKKVDKSLKNSDDYKIMDSLSAEANVDLDKEFIPDKKSFDKNMKTLEKYLHTQ